MFDLLKELNDTLVAESTKIAYENSGGDITVKVHDGQRFKMTGAIRKVPGGYQYFPNGKKEGGEVCPTLVACKKTLEDELVEEALIAEGRGDDDLMDLIEKYMDQENIHNFEGARGVRNLEKIFSVLGYSDTDAFLEDNPGCQQAIVEWIGQDANVSEWVDSMKDALHKKDDEDDND